MDKNRFILVFLLSIIITTNSIFYEVPIVSVFVCLMLTILTYILTVFCRIEIIFISKVNISLIYLAWSACLIKTINFIDAQIENNTLVLLYIGVLFLSWAISIIITHYRLSKIVVPMYRILYERIIDDATSTFYLDKWYSSSLNPQNRSGKIKVEAGILGLFSLVSLSNTFFQNQSQKYIAIALVILSIFLSIGIQYLSENLFFEYKLSKIYAQEKGKTLYLPSEFE